MKTMCLFYLVSAIIIIQTALDAASVFPLKISSNGRYLMDQNNVPFFVNGDTPWSLFANVTKEDAALYLEDRCQRGFTAGLCNLIEHAYCNNPPTNAYGVRPFTTPGDFSLPSETYFQHADWVINTAAEKGIVLFICPSYVGYGCGSSGWASEMGSNGVTKCRNYGRYLGNRYKNAHNIVWVGGGDADAGACGRMAQMDAIMEGIKEMETIKPKLMTAHCSRNNSALDCYNRPWLDINSTYSSYDNALSESLNDWSAYLSRKMPFFYIEGAYEEGNSGGYTVRLQAYQNVLSGSTGHFMGNCPLWGFGSNGGHCSGTNWKASLGSEGSRGVTYLGALMNSREWWKLTPDVNHSVVTGGYSGVAAALTSDSRTLMAYMPSRRALAVNMSKISGSQAKAWWYETKTGTATLIGTFPASGSKSFSPPTSSHDWCLVVDDAAANFPRPGEKGLSTGISGQSNQGTSNMPDFSFEQILPNPFYSVSTLDYSLSRSCLVQIRIYSQAGRVIRVLVHGNMDRGRHTVQWDGRDNAGIRLASGIYIVKMKVGNHSRIAKLIFAQ